MINMLEQKNRYLFYMGTLSPYPWDLALSGKLAVSRGSIATPAHACASAGAPVASLRSRTLRRGDVQYKADPHPFRNVIAGPGSGTI